MKKATAKTNRGLCRPEFLKAAELVIKDLASKGAITADKEAGLMDLLQLERESGRPRLGYEPWLAGFPDSVKKKCGPIMDRHGLKPIIGWRDNCNGSWRLLLIDLSDQLYCLATKKVTLWRVSLAESLDMYSGARYAEERIIRPAWLSHWFDQMGHKLRWIEELESRRPRVKWLKGGAK